MNEATRDIVTFDRPVVLVGAAPVPVLDDLALLPAEWPVIAVDGGASAALAAGRVPTILLGDMDSVNPALEIPATTRQIRMEGQNDTDLEKALTTIVAPVTIGIGFLGGRLDHSLAATHALACLSHDRPVILIDQTDIMVRVRGDFAVRLDVGTRFSVWPLGAQRFTGSTGLKWPLDARSAITPMDPDAGLAMQIGRQTGTSNETITEDVRISAGPGDGYAVILPRKTLPDMLAALID